MTWQAIYRDLVASYGWTCTQLDTKDLPLNFKGGKGTVWNYLKSPTRDIAIHNGYLYVKAESGGTKFWRWKIKLPSIDCGIGMDKKTNLMTFVITNEYTKQSIPVFAMDIS